MKYKVKVIIKAEVEYEVEVDADSEHKAEDIATGMWREKTPDDFQVNKGYITDWEVDETEQLTYYCVECDKEYSAKWRLRGIGPKPLQPWEEDQDYCEECGPKVEAREKAEEAARDAARAQRRLYAATVAAEGRPN